MILSIDGKLISTHLANAQDEYQDATINIDEIKKAELDDDYILTFYNENDEILNFKLSNFSHTSIQALLEMLNNLFPIILNPKLIDKGISSPLNPIHKSQMQVLKRKRNISSDKSKRRLEL